MVIGGSAQSILVYVDCAYAVSGGEELVPGPGLEPGLSAPKADVLPIALSRNRGNSLAEEKECAKPGNVREGRVSAKLVRLRKTQERWPSGLRRTLGKRV